MGSDTKTVRGIVIPMGWDDRGLVLTLGIATYNEDVYLVENSAFGRVLNKFLRQKITAAGSIKQTGKDQLLTVTSFRSDTIAEQTKDKDR